MLCLCRDVGEPFQGPRHSSKQGFGLEEASAKISRDEWDREETGPGMEECKAMFTPHIEPWLGQTRIEKTTYLYLKSIETPIVSMNEATNKVNSLLGAQGTVGKGYPLFGPGGNLITCLLFKLCEEPCSSMNLYLCCPDPTQSR